MAHGCIVRINERLGELKPPKPFLPPLPSTVAPPNGPHILHSARRLMNKSGSAPSFRHSSIGEEVGGPHGDMLPGAIAASWSRRLPEPGTSKAAYVVRSRMAGIEDAIKARSPHRLELAMRKVHGGEYMKTMSAVRKDSTIPVLHRHALESAMASHIVKARGVLAEWHKGVAAVKHAQEHRDGEALQDHISKWNFAHDDQHILDAQSDLDTWYELEEAMAPIVQKAIEDQDMKRLRNALGKLQKSGRKGLPYIDDALLVLRTYDEQTKQVKKAVKSLESDAIIALLGSWRFKQDDKAVQDARGLLRQRDEQLRELCRASEAVTGGPGAFVDEVELETAILSWKFESHQIELTNASDLLGRYRTATGVLTELANQTRPHITALRSALKEWPFAYTPDICPELARVAYLLKVQEEAVAKAEEDERIRVREEAKARADADARAKARAEEEARQKAEEAAKLKAEEEARLKAEEEARIKAEEDAILKAEEDARIKAEEEARAEAEAKAKKAKAKAEAEATAKAEEEAKAKAALDAEEEGGDDDDDIFEESAVPEEAADEDEADEFEESVAVEVAA